MGMWRIPERESVATSRRVDFWEASRGFAKSLGDFRDGVLVVGSVTYVLGYLSWAFYAARHGLGLVPAFDTQYLMAGVVPLLGLVLFVVGARALMWLNAWRRKPLRPELKKWNLILSIAWMGMMAAALVAGLVARQPPSVVGVLIGMGTVLLYGTYFFSRARHERAMQVLGVVALWLYLVAFGIYLPHRYFNRWFELVPQEWGGPGARLVALDIEGNKLSPQMRAMLLGSPATAEPEGTVRTRPVRLVFEGSEFLYFFPRDGREVLPTDIFRLRRSIVVALVPLRAVPVANRVDPSAR